MNDRSRDGFDLDELLHPAQAFDRPSEVVNDPDLTLNEKRAILASWASDACAVEAPRHFGPLPAASRCASMRSWMRCARSTARQALPMTAAVTAARFGAGHGPGAVAAGRDDQGPVLH